MACSALGTGFGTVAAVAGAVFALFLFLFQRKITPLTLSLTAVSLACVLYLASFGLQIAPVLPLEGETMDISGIVQDYPEEKYGKLTYVIEVDEFQRNGEPEKYPKTKIQASAINALFCRPGDRVRCTVSLSRFPGNGIFSTESAQWARGIFLRGYLKKEGSAVVEAGSVSSPGIFFAELRHTLARGIDRQMWGEPAGLIKAMLLGNRNGISQETQSNFRDIGASHLLVISGLHMTVIAAFFGLLLSGLKLSARVKNLLASGMILGFLALLGFPFSAMRSGITMIFFLLAQAVNREAESVNSLGMAVGIICLFSPFSGGDVGLALSVGATLGILKMATPLQLKLMKPVNRIHLGPALRPLVSGLAVSLSAMAGTLPVQLLVFGGFSLLAPVSSLLLMVPFTLLLYVALPCMALFSIPVISLWCGALGLFLTWIGKGLLWAVKLLAGQGIPYVSIPPEAGVVVLLAAGCGYGIYRVFERQKWIRNTAVALSLSLLLFAGFMEWESYQGGYTLLVPDEGKASAVILVRRGEAAVLCADGYNPQLVLTTLRQANVRRVATLCYLSDSVASQRITSQILSGYPVNTLCVQQNQLMNRSLKEIPFSGKQITFEESVSLEALPGIEMELSEWGKRISFTAGYGTRVVVERGRTSGGVCDLLITNQPESKIVSGFTVFQSDGIMEENKFQNSAGAVLPVAESRLIKVRLERDMLYLK